MRSSPRLLARAEAIFERTVDLPPDERSAALASIDDPDLREMVERLLAADAEAEAEDFLGAPAKGAPLPAQVYRGARESEAAQPTAPSEETPPKRFGPYEVEREVGRGGMGVVYLARDPRLDRQVAVKCLHPELAEDPSNLERLRREAKILAALRHPNLATLYGLEEPDGRPCLIMEWIPGETLREKLLVGPLRLRETLRITADLAGALATAHERGVVHRDLKPSNICITPEGDIKVLDFGIAKSAATRKPASSSSIPVGDVALTERGVILGTASYMSPEQVEGDAIDARTDVWAFGCVLWECLCGTRAFKGETTWETLDRVVRHAPEWSKLPVRSPAMRRILQRCLEKDPDRRPRDLRDVRLELLELRRGAQTAPESAPTPESETTPKKLVASSRKKPIGTYFVASAAILLGLSIGLLANLVSLPPERQDVLRLDLHLPLIEAGHDLQQPFFRLSPDGEELVYQGLDQNDDPVLLRRSLGSWESAEIVGAEKVSAPFFSPDGEWVGFFVAAGPNRGLARLALQGSRPEFLVRETQVGAGASWSDDGWIVYAPTWQSGLWAVPEEGGDLHQWTRPDASRDEISHRWPYALPNGRGVLYTVKNTHIQTFDEARIDVFDRRIGESKTLIAGGTMPAYSTGRLIWAREDALYAAAMDLDRLELTGPAVRIAEGVLVNAWTGFAAYDAAGDVLLHALHRSPRTTAILAYDLDGKKEMLFPPDHFLTEARASPDGKKLLTKRIAANNSLFLFDLERQSSWMVPFDGGNIDSPLFSPDGRHIAFVAEREGMREIVRLRTDAATAPATLTTGPDLVLCDWSANAGLLFQRSDPETDLDLWVLPPNGSARAIRRSRGSDDCGRFSAAGDLLAVSSQESGRSAIFVHAYPEISRRIQVATGAAPVWSGDGRLFFTSQGFVHTVEVRDENGELYASTPQSLFAIEGQIEEFDGHRFLTTKRSASPSISPRLKALFGWAHELKNRAPGDATR